MKLKYVFFIFLLLFINISNNTFGQKNYLDMIGVSKTVRLLDTANFAYIVHEKGSQLLAFLCNDDMKDFKGFLAITYDDAIKKDSKVKDLPYVPEGEYLFWDEKKQIWVSKKGSLHDVLTIIAENN